VSACILWHGAVNGDGYGTIAPSRRVKLLAHVEAFKAVHGVRPPVVMHTCDNPRCVNPDHLVAGTQALNMQDMARKGRAARLRGVTNGRAKLTEKSVIRIRMCRGALSCNKLAALYDVDRSTITDIWKRKSWKHLGSGPSLLARQQSPLFSAG